MAKVDVIMPQMGESITEGTLVKWLKKEGDAVERDDPLFEISTEKVDVEIPSPATGTLAAIKVQEGETVPINTVVALIDDAGEGAETPAESGGDAAEAPPAREASAPADDGRVVEMRSRREPAPADDGRRVRSSPLVRRIAREHDIDLGVVEGTGLGGRITKDDILAYIEQGEAGGAEPAARRPASPAPAAQPVAAREPRAPLVGRVEPMSTMRKKIAEHMIESRRTSAHVATVFEIDMSAIARQREGNKRRFQENFNTKLTYTAFIARAVVQALQQYPLLNASIDGDSVVYHEHVNLGIAVALEDGLIVPVIKSAEEKNLLGLQRAINDLGGRARNRKLLPDEVTGGTFTITNPGIYGGMFGIPIINQPQVAILGCGGIEKRPVVIDDAIAIRPMAYYSLSFDHRLIDGALADQFMVAFKQHLQEPDDVG